MGILDRLFSGHGGGHGGGYGVPPGGYGNVPPPSAGGTVACPSCRAINAVGARFCQQCGTSLTPLSLCAVWYDLAGWGQILRAMRQNRRLNTEPRRPHGYPA